MPSSVGPSGRGPVINRNTSAGLPPEGPQLNPLIGRKVMTRWPDDNSFYEAVITDYDAAKVSLISKASQLSLVLVHIINQVAVINCRISMHLFMT
jgi:hypothetical protein